jgi:hypothetical protein
VTSLRLDMFSTAEVSSIMLSSQNDVMCRCYVRMDMLRKRDAVVSHFCWQLLLWGPLINSVCLYVHIFKVCESLCMRIEEIYNWTAMKSSSWSMRNLCAQEWGNGQQNKNIVYSATLYCLRHVPLVFIYLFIYRHCQLHLYFLFLCTIDRTPWTGDQPVARPLREHNMNIK